MIFNPIIQRELIGMLRTRKAMAVQVLLVLMFAALVIFRWPSDPTVDLAGNKSQEVFRLFGYGLLTAIIVLVQRDSRALFGRKPEWPPNRYSTIAGFVEPGESAEQAVVREVDEETGIDVTAVRYHSSQPWPFPGSLMLGYHAQAGSERISRSTGSGSGLARASSVCRSPSSARDGKR